MGKPKIKDIPKWFAWELLYISTYLLQVENVAELLLDKVSATINRPFITVLLSSAIDIAEIIIDSKEQLEIILGTSQAKVCMVYALLIV